MSRIAGAPIELPKGVEVNISGAEVSVKGPKGQLSHSMHELVAIEREDDSLKLSPSAEDPRAMAITGTTRSLINNMVTGVTAGFERKLELVGVGYRAQVKGNTLNLALGFSHPIDFPVPEGVSIETPTQTEITVRGIDKQKVGQTAAVIRGFRPPEPYKGKGVKYADELIVRKEAKKK